MKRITALILALCLCACLCACKSSEAKKADELILAIGEVCCIWHPSVLLSTGMHAAKIGTWFSVNWRSCSQIARWANSLVLGFPIERDGIHAARGAHTVALYRESSSQGK